jgi:hypothetical protein
LIQSKLFVCADSAAVDARTSALSIFHVLEQLSSPAFPVAVPRVAIVFVLSREEADPANLHCQLQIHSGNQQLIARPVPVNFQQQFVARVILEMYGVVVPAPGNLRFELMNGEALLGSWSVLVNQVGGPVFQMNLPVAPLGGGPPPEGDPIQ